MRKKGLIYFISGLFLVAALTGFYLFRMVFGLSIQPMEGKSQIIFLPEGSTYNQAMDSIKSNLIVKDFKVLKWVAERKNYPSLVKPGRYVINKGLSCNELINILRSGRQTPVMITFSNIRTLNDLAGRVGGRIEADSARIIAFLSDPENYRMDGFSRENVISVFIPNTYEFFWNTSAGDFYSRMLREYKTFWNEKRLEKADDENLTPVEVSILASIIDKEVVKSDEKSRIAGVYLNRLKRGIPLQADPTIKFALNDFNISRILYKHLAYDSPYNTYKHAGLPPGPIGCASIEGIDAVLNAESHDYIFFVAKPDFSGYHNFSRTLSEHNRYAALYQRELNKRRIFK
jgi:UPF0755 protein